MNCKMLLLQPLTQLPSSSLPPKPFSSDHSLSLLSSHFHRLYTSRNPRLLRFTVRSCQTQQHQARAKTLLPKTAIQRIAEKLRSLGFTEDDPSRSPNSPSSSSSTRVGEIFVPLPSKLPRQRVGHTIDTSWSSPENPVPEIGTGTAIKRFRELKKEARKEKKELSAALDAREDRVPTLAELTLPAKEVKRLTTLGIKLRKKLKVGKAGLTEGIVNGIHERWRRSEVVKIECEDISRINMKRTHDLLEKKTGGLVVWRSGSKIVLFRGTNYKYPYFLSYGSSINDTSSPEQDIEDVEETEDDSKPINKLKTVQPALVRGVGLKNRMRFQLPGEAQIAEEADRLLDGLGPRFTEWWGYDPQPVDADLLPPVVHNYRRPFRLLPYGVQAKLTDDEMTTIRRLARPLPCHFALSRNRNLQGLAASIVKLWERCEVAKIAVKRGAQNTNSELMAEELKNLTGGTLLARDREFIVLYRGKDFLPLAVSSAIEERRKHVLHAKKPKAEHKGLSVEPAQNKDDESTVVEDNNYASHLPERKMTSSLETSVEKTSIKLSMALEKKAKAEKLLAELEKGENRQQPEVDKEGITEEERYMLRKIALRMKPFLLMGRRGVFDGTIENMHLHWKYRELVKIVTNERSIEVVTQAARSLETESGGILVAIERVSKGFAIIVYRGKNYIRPASLRPQTLLNKRSAMKRSIEAQRRESLKLHVLKLDKNIDDLNLQLVKDEEANKKQYVDESSEMVQDEASQIQSAESSKLDGASPMTSSVEDLDEDQDEASQIQSAEILKLDAEVEYDSPSPLTTSFKDIDAGPDLEKQSRLLDKTSLSSGVSGQVRVSEKKSTKSTEKSDMSRSELSSFETTVDKKPNTMPSGALYLSNKERLLLRRQALKMKKRPVLAVGRSNIITGVAKTIKAHFQKHPLAIVNVKGRAKGTSVQEVIFMLEKSTGGVLVSQEPSKVILYRGWGAGESSDRKKTEKNTDDPRPKIKSQSQSQPVVSPELLDAIRTECGLQNQLTEEI